MITQYYPHFIAWIGATVLMSCAAPSSAPVRKVEVSSPHASNAGRSDVSGNQIFRKVNEYRACQGKSALQRHAGLDRIAQDHCEYLRKNRDSFRLSGRNVSHIGFDGRATLARHMYQMNNVSENIACAMGPGQSGSQRMVDLWRSSKDHHKNMLDDWTWSGVGVVTDTDGAIIATQIFGNSGMSHLSTRERFNRH